MSTQEDREHDEHNEYGWSFPLDPFMRHSAILEDREEWRDFTFDPQPVEESVDSPPPTRRSLREQPVTRRSLREQRETPGQTLV